MRTEAQIKAQKKADKKRSSRPLFSVRMSQEEKEYCHSVLDQYSDTCTKKEMLLKAIRKIDKNNI